MNLPITAQQVFTAAWNSFIVGDNPPAMRFDDEEKRWTCSYLTPERNKCVVGLCIPDGHPAQHFKFNVPNLALEYPDLLAPDDIPIIQRLQVELHDDLCSIGVWLYSKELRKTKYTYVAREYNLTIPE